LLTKKKQKQKQQQKVIPAFTSSGTKIKTIPSVVSFDEPTGKISVGSDVPLSIRPGNTVSNSKRLIGRRFDSPSVQHDIKYLPFKVVANQNNEPVIAVIVKGREELYDSGEISAFVIGKMRDVAGI